MNSVVLYRSRGLLTVFYRSIRSFIGLFSQPLMWVIFYLFPTQRNLSFNVVPAVVFQEECLWPFDLFLISCVCEFSNSDTENDYSIRVNQNRLENIGCLCCCERSQKTTSEFVWVIDHYWFRQGRGFFVCRAKWKCFFFEGSVMLFSSR